MAPKVIKYTIKKGDMLDKIAKKYGLKSGQFIFDAKVNSKVKKLRKEPSKIQPGDVFIIPAPDPSTIKTHFTSKGARMSIDVDGPKKLIFVQQKWAYTYFKQAAASAWNNREKKDFHNNVDKLIWKHWSGKFTFGVKGTSEFVKVYKDTEFKCNFDIESVSSGGHWEVKVTKIRSGGAHLGSEVKWNDQVILLDTFDTLVRIRTKEGKQFKQIAAVHEFGHAVGNTYVLDRGDEYRVGNTYEFERNSMMNVGMQLKKRYTRTLVEELNKMIPKTEFFVKRVG